MAGYEGNGEHPELRERRRRKLLQWLTLAALIVFGEVIGAIRLLYSLWRWAGTASVVYQLVLLGVNTLLGVYVVIRVRRLRRG